MTDDDVPSWLADAVFYEIYPQSFADSDGDGIGDLPGALAHLDHLSRLGVNTVWFNPCFASPFRDAGYDVSDYLRIAPRYGTNEDLVAYVRHAADRGIRVVLDLVAGHTSVAHEWFRSSLVDDADDRYIWSDRPGDGYVRSPGPRAGYYLRNFFDEQPALNFGFARMSQSEPWREPVDAPGPRANRAALRQILAFWLDQGVAGFRVDMAFSLVKDDPGRVQTALLWRELRDWLRDAYPDAVLLPESDLQAPADVGVRAGFDADFFLVISEAHSVLFNNGGAGRLEWLPEQTACYFQDARSDPAATIGRFVEIWAAHKAAAGADRLVVIGSADHDFDRLATRPRTQEQLGAAFAFLLTWQSIPSIYYGDEIGMRYLPGLPDHEGSIANPHYNRGGARTPMQWDADLVNLGFSSAPKGDLYLPQDEEPDRPTVHEQANDPGSTLNRVQRLIAVRRTSPALRPTSSLEVLHAGYPLAFVRGGELLVVVNPLGETVEWDSDDLVGAASVVLEGVGVHVEGSLVRVAAFGYGVIRLRPQP